jgi:hypothetical protein
MRTRAIAWGTVAAAALTASLGLAVSRPGHAQPQLTRLERMNAVGARVKRAMGPRARYLSAAWQTAIGVSNRFDQLTALGLKPSLAEIAAPAVSAPAGHFGPVSSPPDLGVTRFSTFSTSETSTAWCGSNAVVAFNDSGSLLETTLSEGASLVGYSRSTDAGTSFNDLGTPPPLSDTLSMVIGDPVVKCTSRRDFLLSSIFQDCADAFCLTATNGVTVWASSDGGASFGTPVEAVSQDMTQHIVDKDWMTVDPKNPNNIFVTYTDFDVTESNQGCSNPFDVLVSIKLLASTTGLSGFATATPVEVAVGQCNETLQGSQVVVAPDGTIYVAWEKIAVDGVTREIDVAKSSDGGISFGAPVKVAGVGCAGDCSQLQGMIRTNEFPSLAVNTKGKLFMVWNDGDFQVPDALAPLTSGGLSSSYGFTDIKFSRSNDGGGTWSSPVRVNTNPASSFRDHFEPTVAVGSGRIAVCFYDRRNDPLNFLIDRYCANSTDGGATWTNTRITARNFSSVVAQDVLLVTNYMGDYDAMAPDTLAINAGFIDSFAANSSGYPRVRANTF